MYFTAADREQLNASSKVFYDENFTEDYDGTLQSKDALDYSDVNYSSKTVNPEYIAKYTSDNIDETDDSDDVYFDENYKDAEIGSAPAGYSSTTGGVRPSGVGIYPTFAFGMGTGYGGNPYGFRDPYGFGYGSSTYMGIGFGTNPYYSSFGRPWYGYSYSPWRSRWGYDPYGPYNYAYGYGAGSYCPSTFTGYSPTVVTVFGGSNNSGIDPTPAVASVRKTSRSPRSTRGSTYSRGGNNSYRSGSADGKVYIPDGSSIQTSSRTTRTASTGSRNNYYRRSANRTGSSNPRNYVSGRTTTLNSSADYTRSRSSATSNYSRSSGTRSYRNNFLKQITSGSSSTPGSSFRSTSNSGSRSFSTPSRGSSSGSRSSSFSTPSRSSSSGRSSGSSSSGRGRGRN